jgi:hypothetical protein
MGGVAAPELPMPGGTTRCHGHVGACEHTSCHSSYLRACMRGYPVYRVPTVVPGLTPGDAANPRVGSTSFSHAAFLNFVPWYFKAIVQPCQ